jgi:hypothetical protein
MLSHNPKGPSKTHLSSKASITMAMVNLVAIGVETNNNAKLED